MAIKHDENDDMNYSDCMMKSRFSDQDENNYRFYNLNVGRYFYRERKISRYFCEENDIVLVGTFVPGEYKRQATDLRVLPEYRAWRESVFKRDNYTCRKCGSRNDLQTHHIKQVILHPDLMFDIDNGVTLCKECHKDIPVERL